MYFNVVITYGFCECRNGHKIAGKKRKKKLHPKKSLQSAMISPRKALIPKMKTQRPHFSPETSRGIKVNHGKKTPNGKLYTIQTERQSKGSKRVQLKSK